MSEAEVLVDIIAHHIIPILPDVTQIPAADWSGWGRAIDALAEAQKLDPNNAGLVAETTAKCQTVLQQLLQAAMASNQQQVQEHALPGADQQVSQLSVDPQPGAVLPATEGQITASELQLTQLVGSAAEQPVLLQQPKAHIIARAKLPRGERLEIWYQLAFEGYPESDAEWFPANRIRSEYPNGNELIQKFEHGLDQTGQQDASMPEGALGAAAMPPAADGQLPTAAPLAVDLHGEDAASVGVDAAGMQLQYADAAGSKRLREDDEADDDASKRQRANEDAAAAAAAGLDPAAADQAAAAAASAAAAEAATSAGMAAQLAAGGQLFAMGADGQPMLQVVPLQVDSQLGQMGQLAGVELSQFAGMDPQMLQALSLQGMQMGNMGQLVLHVPGAPAGSHPMLAAAGLQLAGLPGLGMAPAPVHHTPGREAVIAYVKEAIKMLMHSSEELQRKKRQQSRRSELNQRRALLLPDGSAAPGALPTTAAGTPAPPPVRPNNMLAAIQALPPLEKRNMLVGALRRALPIMMQTAQAGHTHDFGAGLISRQSQDSAAMAAAAEHDVAMLQYQQLLAAGGQPGMQIIAVPLQNGMQGLMQVPLTAEQLQSMSQGGAITLDANGQLQLPASMMMADPNAMAAAAAANPGMLASMGMLTAEQMQQLGLQAGDPAAAAAGLDPAALAAAAAAAAAGMAVPGQDLTAAGAVQLSADATAALLAAQDPNAAAAAAMAAAAASGAIQYDPAAMAEAMAAPAAAGGTAAALHAPDGTTVQDGHPAAGADTAAVQATVDAAAAAAAAAAAGVAGYTSLDPTAAGQQLADGASTAAAAPAADGATAAAGGGKQDDAILAAISLTNLSRMPAPDEEDGAPAAADATDPASAAATSAAGGVDASQQLAGSEGMQAAVPMAAPPAAVEQHVQAAAAELAMQHSEHALRGVVDQQQEHFLQQDQLQLQLHDHVGDGKQYVQLPAHLAGMQQMIDGLNPELLNPQLATQDFTAAGMQ